MPGMRKPDPRATIIAVILQETAPSTVRDAFQAAGLGREADGIWIWAPKVLRDSTMDELKQIRRIMGRSAHFEVGA